MSGDAWPKVSGFLDSVREGVRVVRYSSPAKRWAYLGLTLIATIPAWFAKNALTDQFPVVEPVLPWLLSGLQATGLLCLAVSILYVWRSPMGKPGPASVESTAIKGPESFGPQDGELYCRLGRERELADLRGKILDSQTPLVAVKGESGSGKTSLLRAGLPFALEKDHIKTIYYEATPNDSIGALYRAIVSHGISVPSDYQKLVGQNWPPCVIIIDQLEQLSPMKHEELFGFLHSAVSSEPPYAATIVVAFREDFASQRWDFELRWSQIQINRTAKISLSRFEFEKAMEIVEVLLDAAKLDIDRAAARKLLDEAAVGGKVSPVDIGITLMALSQLKLDSSPEFGRATITGGQIGLLKLYIRSRLTLYFPHEDFESIVNLMLGLIDPQDSRGRLAVGRTAEELAPRARALGKRRIDDVLQRLASRNVRLLEQLPPENTLPPRFRLAHEKFIPALRSLAQVTLAKAAQTLDEFERLYRQWAAIPSARYLLSGREIRAVKQYEEEILWGDEEADKREFLRRSARRAKMGYAITCAVASVSCVLGSLVAMRYQSRLHMRELMSWGLPGDLYQRQSGLNGLYLDNAPITALEWRSRDLKDFSVSKTRVRSIDFSKQERSHTLESLTVTKNSNLTNISGLAELNSLQTLLINGNSELISISDLGKLSNLRSLTLEGNGKLDHVTGLERLSSLHSLTIVGGRNFGQLPELNDLSNLQSFTVGRVKSIESYLKSINGEELTAIPKLAALSSLRSLEIIGDFDLKNIAALREFSSLQSLTISSNNGLKNLPDLKGLSGLQSLTITDNTNLMSVTGLRELPSLQSLTISGNINLVSLSGLPELSNLQSVTIKGNTKLASLLDLKGLTGLRSLTVTANRGLVSDLSELGLSGLRSLSIVGDGSLSYVLDLGSSEDLTVLPDLSSLSGLELLTISDTKYLTSVPNLAEMRNLKSLNISRNIELQSISDLSGLNRLKSLTLGDNDKLEGIPNFGGLTALESLTIAGNRNWMGVFSLEFQKGLSELPRLAELHTLRSLTIDGNFDLSNSPEFGDMTDLRSLVIAANSSLTSLPNLGNLPNLRLLEIANSNNLTEFPNLGGLVGLQTLTISGNEKLTGLPDLGSLSSLRVLAITGNVSLTGVSDLSGLQQLAALDYSNNGAGHALSNLKKLEGLALVKLEGTESKDLSILPPSITHLFVSTGQFGSMYGLQGAPESVRNLGFSAGDVFSQQVEDYAMNHGFTYIRPSDGG